MSVAVAVLARASVRETTFMELNRLKNNLGEIL